MGGAAGYETRKRVRGLVGILGCAESACSCNPIRSLDLKLSCDKKVVPTARACADGQTGYRRHKLVQNHMIVRSNYTIHVHMLTQHNDVRRSHVRVWLVSNLVSVCVSRTLRAWLVLSRDSCNEHLRRTTRKTATMNVVWELLIQMQTQRC